MSSEAASAIEVRGVGKRYRYGAGAEGRLAESVQRGLRRLAGRAAAERETFWAVRDVSLTVAPGEVVGIIGRNGAGKSTMLKLLARITAPTEGEIVMRGRIASLLEVGAGFDPELSGRENVFLSGAILGMRGREIAEKFDEIVAFSGIEKFIDTPVKRYSSGMFVRLAFAVGAHLESDILLVDEVLSVGDAEFQRKCLAKMREVSDRGRTILFVSHNLHAVQHLCHRAYLLDGGRVCASGGTANVVAAYLDRVGAGQDGAEARVGGLERAGSGDARLQRVALVDREGLPTQQVGFGESLEAALTFEVHRPISDAIVQIGVSTVDGMRVATAHSSDGNAGTVALDAGPQEVRVRLDIGMLPGNFLLDVGLYHAHEAVIDHLDGALRFSARDAGSDALDRYPLAEVRGAVRPLSEWTFPAACESSYRVSS